MDVLILLGMGAIAGTLAGLLGIGGGIIIVPVLALVFAAQGISKAFRTGLWGPTKQVLRASAPMCSCMSPLAPR